MNLKIKIGCDIVEIDRFAKLLENGKETLLNNLFSKHELANTNSVNSLAGIFAAKESIVKALELAPGDWHLIEIIKASNGKPTIKLNNVKGKEIISHDISISHDGNYAFATSCFLINNPD